jgi:hypothetical protein
MSENAAKPSRRTQEAPTRKRSHTGGSGEAHGVPEPHIASLPPKVLAQVPDLEAADSATVNQTPAAQPDGRLLSTRLSMLILAGGGSVLLLAALGLPILLSGSDSPDNPLEEPIPSWPVEPPAPAASVAPAWDAAAEQPTSWPVPADPSAVPQLGLPAAPTWGDSTPSTNREAHPPARSWDGSTPTHPQPSPQAAEWQQQPQPSPWPAPQYGPAGPGPGPSASPDSRIPSPSPALDPGRLVPGNNVSRQPGPAFPGSSSWQEGGFPAAPPSPPSYGAHPQNAYRPQAEANRSMTLGRSVPSAALGGSPERPPDPRAEYRTADAHATLAAPHRAGDPADYRGAPPAADRWHTENPRASGPPADYPAATYPVAGQSEAGQPRADTISPNRRIPNQFWADPSYETAPAAGYPVPQEARYREPGVARLRGGIEKPTESSVYEQHRSSVY